VIGERGVTLAGLVLVLFLAAPAAAQPRQTLSGRIEGARGHTWRWAFDVGLERDAVRVRVTVHPVPTAGVGRAELDRALARWEVEVERIWSGTWAVRVPGGRRYPVLLDLAFAARGEHHQVVVSRSGDRVDAVHWRLGDAPAVVAHEVGHMLGLYDEYRDGARAPGPFEPDPESVMAQGGGRGRVRARHFQRILSWFRQRTGLEAELVPLGEGGDVLAERVPPGRYDSSSGQRGEP